MRGADGGPWNIICALPALWVGLLYDNKAQLEAYDLAKPFMNTAILEEGRISAAKYGLNGKLGGRKIINIAEEMIRISSLGLERRNKLDNRGIDERQFLDPLLNIVRNKKTGSEILLEKFNGIWRKNIDKVFIENAF